MSTLADTGKFGTNAKSAAEEAIRRAQEVELIAREAANMATKVANEAFEIAGGAIPKSLVRKIIASWDFIALLLIVLLASIMGAVAISLGLSLLYR